MVTHDRGGFAAAEPPAGAGRGPGAVAGAHPDIEPAPEPPPVPGGGQAVATPATARPGWLSAAWREFRSWRRHRPFWGAVLAILGGAEIFYTETAPINVVVHFGLVGQLGFAVPILVVLCGLLLLFAPQPRAFYASLLLLLGLASWLTSNLGGFFLGMLLVLIGGALALSWTNAPKRARPPRTSTADSDVTANVDEGVDGG